MLELQPPLNADRRGAKAVLHDVNNLLMTVASLVVQTRNSLGPDNGGRAHQIIEMLGSAVGETLTLARAGQRHTTEESFSPAPYLSEHVAAFAGLFSDADRFSVTLRPGCSSARVALPRIDLLRVLTNLIRNAEQASEPDGHVELTLDLLEASSPIEMQGTSLASGTYVSFRVIDGGCGFGGEQPKAALPSDGPRGGIGLEVTKGLLKEAAGGLRVSAREGGGTIVEALLPTVD